MRLRMALNSLSSMKPSWLASRRSKNCAGPCHSSLLILPSLFLSRSLNCGICICVRMPPPPKPPGGSCGGMSWALAAAVTPLRIANVKKATKTLFIISCSLSQRLAADFVMDLPRAPTFPFKPLARGGQSDSKTETQIRHQATTVPSLVGNTKKRRRQIAAITHQIGMVQNVLHLQADRQVVLVAAVCAPQTAAGRRDPAPCA